MTTKPDPTPEAGKPHTKPDSTLAGKAKHILGELPLAAEIYWQIRQRGNPPGGGFKLSRIDQRLPELVKQAGHAKRFRGEGDYPAKRVMIFSTLRYWIEHSVLMGLALAGSGHQVSLTYLPYAKFQKPIDRFDLRRQNAYARKVLKQASPLMRCASLLDAQPASDARQKLPAVLLPAIEEVSLRDAQYTLQVEEVDRNRQTSPSARLYHLRLERNFQAAAAALTWIEGLKPQERPEVLVTPNGSILEMGAIYQVARYLDIPVVTYEFGEQRGRIWLAHNREVMRQETDELWQAFRSVPLTESQWEQVRALYASRQNAHLWENFSRLWQGVPSQGSEQVRRALGLDGRPVVLLAANVIGDSLTLGRQIFSQTMTEWLERTAQYFIKRSDVQVIIRIHPGERYITGPSVAQVIQRALPSIPTHIHLVQALDPVNTYDLIEIADLGLAYTTTVGMEMAMSGVPTIVAGQTHYRDKGFTLDPDDWEHYYQVLEETLASPGSHRLSREQVETAWAYAYRFFFDYPCPFPWHLLNWWNELDTCSMEYVLSPEGRAAFGDTLDYLAGASRKWSNSQIEDLPGTPDEAAGLLAKEEQFIDE